MTLAPSQRIRCPCCGETFMLSDAHFVPEAPPEEQESGSLAGDTSIPVSLVFDGGSIGNPGRGYGSYQITILGKAESPRRLKFGDQYTNNEAEYETLIEALQALLRRATEPQRVHLDIRGDSQLVINQLNGVWKARDPRMQERKERALALLARFGKWTATWHDRGKSVKALGH